MSIIHWNPKSQPFKELPGWFSLDDHYISGFPNPIILLQPDVVVIDDRRGAGRDLAARGIGDGEALAHGQVSRHPGTVASCGCVT